MNDPNAFPPLARRNLLAACASTLFLAGCGDSFSLIQPSSSPLALYRLQPEFHALDDAPRVDWQLVIARPYAMQSLDTERIALVRGQTMDYYANAQWTDSVPRLIQSLLVEAFEQSGKIAAVGRETDGAHADYTLASELRDFTAHFDSDNGAPGVVVAMRAKLVTARGEVVASLGATHTAQAAQNSVASTVEAFDQALGAVLEQIVGWALRAKP